MALILIFLGFMSPDAHAQNYQLNVEEPLRVYAKASSRSSVLATLTPGQVVNLHRSKYKNWYKVSVVIEEELQYGFVLKRRIKKSKVVEVEEIEDESFSYMERNGWGLSAITSSLTQSAFSADVSDSLIEFSELKSNEMALQLFVDSPLNEKWSFRFGLVSRQTNFSGEATEVGATQVKDPVTRKQSLMGLFAQFKLYNKPRGSLWYGFGCEASKGTSVELTKGEGVVETTKDNLPFFIIATGILGYDIGLTRSLFITPEIRIGTDLNAESSTTAMEAVLNLQMNY